MNTGIFFNQTVVRLAGVALLATAFSAHAGDGAVTGARLNFFESRVRPIFVEHCYSCHSQESGKNKGGLWLDSRAGWEQGGNRGPAILPHNPEKSLLLQAVRYTNDDLQMPPKGKKLSATQVADLEAWIKMGAPDPRQGPSAVAQTAQWNTREKSHWAFLPVKKPTVPMVGQTNWVATPVDAFVLQTLEKLQLQPSSAADKGTLLRRVTFDLTGLSPTPQELVAFLEDKSPEAFSTVIDRLLASPRYGERWGRFWLDIARYSDTKGEVKKFREDDRYVHGWTYRDYVIRAFNEDKPYNQFILEQLAADRLPFGRDKSAWAAMGFLTLGERFNNKQEDIINDRIDVVTKGILGLTVACARCHDHKFDPIPTRDYYSLYGVFASSVEPQYPPVMSAPTARADYPEYYSRYTKLQQEDAQLQKDLRARGKAADKKLLRQRAVKVHQEMAELELTHPAAPVRAMVLMEGSRPRDYPVLIRGEAENRGAVVPRQFLDCLSAGERIPFRQGSGRLELARAITSPTNPLTARVMVNRVWLHHFGEGMVSTPDDFGLQTSPPSHPELLDYLAATFVEGGWSVKKLHREILLSNTYQQSSRTRPEAARVDPDNRLLWRANLRRLDFEALRDSILAIGGQLDLSMGGRPVDLGSLPYSTRRTVYGFVDRRNLPEIYNQFDFANPDMSTGKRYQTIVPQQSLFLMNSPLVVEQARQVVGRPDFAALSNSSQRVQYLYRLIYQREASSLEIKLGLQFIEDSPAPEPVTTASLAAARQGNRRAGAGRTANSFSAVPVGSLKPMRAWEKYAHALLQANEAMFLQ